jgi:hypothetical protein
MPNWAKRFIIFIMFFINGLWICIFDKIALARLTLNSLQVNQFLPRHLQPLKPKHTKMKNIISKTLVAAIAALAVGNLAQANPMFDGSIAFASGGGINTSTTTITLASPGIVIAWNGDFGDAGVSPIGAVTFTPSINYGTPVLPIAPLWSFATQDFGAFSFVATTLNWSTVFGSVELSGKGWFMDSGGEWDTTAGTWGLQIGADGSISFAAQTAIPDSGSTILLVGLGIVGLGLYASRKRLVSA